MKKSIYLILVGILITICIVCIFILCNKNEMYIVIFNTLGGTAIDHQYVKAGEIVTKPRDPEKEGFTFVEWQIDNTTYNFNTPITKDLTITAYYMINKGTETVTVMLDYQNGQYKSAVEIVKGGTMTSPPQPQRDGYEFIGWYLDDNKYDFSSKIDGNITLIAKWKVDKNASVTTDRNENINNNSTNNTENVNNNKNEDAENNMNTEENNNVNQENGNIDNNINYDEIVNKYIGRWYLSGYADVFIDVSKSKYYDAMVVQSNRFTLPMEGTSDYPIVPAYTIYPNKIIDLDKGAVYGSSFEIIYQDWNEHLIKHKVNLKDDCIYINNYKFIKNKGTKDCYFDTCYKDALGTWYLYNNPDSKIEITTLTKGDLENADSFRIDATRFNFSNFDTNITYFVGSGHADRNQDWEKYGISVKGDTLTVTNQNGTRTFYKTKTYQKVTGVVLDTTDVSLDIGKTKTVKATVTPSDAYDKTLTWTSNNSNVATVSSSGVITAKGEGTATITVTTNDGKYSVDCIVNVSVIHVSGISINKNSLNMTIGDTQQLSYTITPSNSANRNVTWSSSNESVAQVSSNGKVTAKGKGVANITVVTSDGGYEASCEVVVTEPKLKVTGSIGIGYYMSNSSSVSGIFAKANPSGGSGNYVAYLIKLYYNGTLVAESNKDEVIVSPVQNGTYTAEIYVKDSNGNEATVTKTTTISQ